MNLVFKSVLIVALASLALRDLPAQPHQASPTSPNKSAQPKQATGSETVVVGAAPTKEQLEEWKLEGPVEAKYQDAEKAYARKDCEAAITKYQDTVQAAKTLKSDEVRNKYISLSLGNIGQCQIKLGRDEQAEQTFQSRFESLKVWPGETDSDFPLNYESIATIQMRREDWKSAEENLRLAVSEFDKSIAHFKKSDDYSENDIVANDERRSECITISLLAVVYFRERRFPESLELLDRAYNQAVKFQAPKNDVSQIVDLGIRFSRDAGDILASAVWLKRSLLLN